MNKERNNKRNIILMVYSLCAIASFMAEIYFMVNYKKEYVIIAAIGLVFLVSVGFLLDEIFDAVIKPPVSSNMDELLKVQKAAYLQGKNLTEDINRLFEDGIDSIIQVLEENRNAIIDNEKTVAKVIIKRNGENNDRIREAVEAIDLSKIPVPEIKMPEIAMPEINIPEIKIPEISLPASNNSADIELAKKEIISLIDKLSEQVKNSAKMEDIVELKEMLSKKLENVSVADVTELVEEMPEEEEVPVVKETTVAEDFDINAENTFDDLFKDLENVIPEESVAEMPVMEGMPEETVAPETEKSVKEQVTEEINIAEDFDINAENTFEDLFKGLENVVADDVVLAEMPVMEEMTVEEMPLIMEEMPEEPAAPVVEESIVEEPVVEEPVAEEPAPAISLPAMDSDPNKQLSADEIAALFASIQ